MKNDKDKFKIGSDYTFEMLMPSPNDMLGDIVKGKTGSREEMLTIKGQVIYNNGTTAIIKVKSGNYELDGFTLPYKDVSLRHNDFADNGVWSMDIPKYLCIDIRSEKSLYFRDPETDEIHEAVFDENGEFLGFDYSEGGNVEEWKSQDLNELLPAEAYDRLKKLHTISSSDEDTEINGSLYSKVILSLTPSAARLMERDGVLEQVDDCSILSQGFNRAMKWLTKCNCAIVTAWRDDKPRKVNDENNKALQTALRELGYGIYKMMGFYAEIGKDIRRENSYLVFDQDGTRNLRNDVYRLSEQYEQDCFLYSAKGDAPAILVGTNDKFGKGRCVELGQIEINNYCRENYSKVGNGIISFGY